MYFDQKERKRKNHSVWVLPNEMVGLFGKGYSFFFGVIIIIIIFVNFQCGVHGTLP